MSDDGSEGRRVALVTGADSGIGKASAVRLAREGLDVAITWSTDREGAQEAAREVEEQGVRALVRHLDITDREETLELANTVAQELGGLDVLVNNAGTGASEPFLEHSLETWRDVLEVDLTGPFVLAQRAAQIMVGSGTPGRIINITSVHEHIPKLGSAAYCAAKAGLGLLTKVMALELGEHGITVNSIAPGEIATPMTGAHEIDPAEEERPALPLDRPGHAYEIAEFVALLASPDARYATGSSFIVDGGLMLTPAQFNQAMAEQGE
jgi:NAD(P)-dependent dehydrogenase (short-subunit alcohol dehydrogenase family)